MLKIFEIAKEMKKAGILGMNARNYQYTLKQNNRKYFPLVDNKLETKKLALANGISTTNAIGSIFHSYEVKNLLSII